MYWIICKAPYHTSVAGPYERHETAAANLASFEANMAETNASYYLVTDGVVPPSPVTQWEYRTVVIECERDWYADPKSYGGGPLHPHLNRPTLETLNRVGEEGWEVVALDRSQALLKRPKVTA